jgi:hypothetical protein
MKSTTFLRSAAVLIALLSTLAVNAQSGRKAPQPPAAVQSVPPPAPARSPEPVTVSKRPTAAQFALKLVADFDKVKAPHISLPPNRIRTWALERLLAAPLLEVRDSGDRERDAAEVMARSETEVYVAHLELKKDPNIRWSNPAAPPLVLVVTIYHPNSGKVKISRMIPVARGSGALSARTTLQTCHPDVYGDDILLLEAGIYAADTIMSSFGVEPPPLCYEVRK